jgi:hypothetical protein
MQSTPPSPKAAARRGAAEVNSGWRNRATLVCPTTTGRGSQHRGRLVYDGQGGPRLLIDEVRVVAQLPGRVVLRAR